MSEHENHTPTNGEVPVTTVTLAAPFVLGGEPPPRDPRKPIPHTSVDNDPVDVTFGRKSVLRSIIGGDSGDPEIERLLAGNLRDLEQSPVAWHRPDDQAIYAFVRDYNAEHAGAVPGMAVARDHFERLGDLLVTERLRDIENVRGLVRLQLSMGPPATSGRGPARIALSSSERGRRPDPERGRGPGRGLRRRCEARRAHLPTKDETRQAADDGPRRPRPLEEERTARPRAHGPRRPRRADWRRSGVRDPVVSTWCPRRGEDGLADSMGRCVGTPRSRRWHSRRR